MSVVRDLTTEQLAAWIEERRDFVLLDVLGESDYEALRLPGAKRATVYEVTFLEQAAVAVPSRDVPVVVYGSSEGSRDALEAATKLERAGYDRVLRYPGGRAAWQAAGRPCEGVAAARPWVPRPAVVVADGVYAVDVEESVIAWAGRNVRTRHDGTLGLAGGTVKVEDGAVAAGVVRIDMRAIRVADLEGELAKVLKRHLESDDFFDVERFPSATIEIGEARRRRSALPGQVNYAFRAALTLRGVRRDLDFEGVVAPHGEVTLALQATLSFDRTAWGVHYGSARLYERLAKHLVNDRIDLDVRIVARR